MYQLLELPSEIIINVFRHLALIDLLNVSLIKLNDKIKLLLNQVLLEKLSTVRLRLFFNQENNWKYTLDFQLEKYTASRLAFTPVTVLPEPIRLYTSKLLRKPSLTRVSLLLDGGSYNNKHLRNNLMRSSLSLNIKEAGTYQKAYDQQQKVLFVYNVRKTPNYMTKVRPGERFVDPLGFECPFEFLAQPKSKLEKLADFLHNRPTNYVYHPASSTAAAKICNSNYQLSEIGQFYRSATTVGSNTLSKSRINTHSLQLIR